MYKFIHNIDTAHQHRVTAQPWPTETVLEILAAIAALAAVVTFRALILLLFWLKCVFAKMGFETCGPNEVMVVSGKQN